MTMKTIKALAVGLLLSLAAPLSAFAQCSGQAPATTYCGNPTGAQALPGWKPFSAIPFPSIAGGTVVGNRGTVAATASALTNPILGIPGTSTGEIGLAGLTSGTATLRAQAIAGSAILLLPTGSGTLASAASSPLVLGAATGALTCPTCVTSSGGGAITGTTPISVSAAGVVSINAPYGALTASNGGIVYSGAVNLAILSGTATARQMLQSGASTTPAWSTTTWPATTTINRILYSSAANVIGEITSANSSVLVTDSGGVPSLSTTLPALTLGGTISGGGNQINNVIIGTSTPLAGSFTSLAYSTTLTGTSTNGSCVAIGRQGATSPALQVDCSGATQATGIRIAGAAAGSGANLAAISSGTNENLLIDAKGSGTITFGSISTGGFVMVRALNLGTVGGVAGQLVFTNATSGTITINPPGGALGSAVWTLQAGTDTFVGKATADAFTNKTLTSSTNVLGGVTMTLGSDATGDLYYRSAGVLTRLAIGSATNVLTVVGGVPTWAAASAGGTVTTITAGTAITLSSGATCTTTCTINVDKATAAQLEAGTSNKALTADIIYDAEVTVTFAASQTLDFNTFLNARITATANTTSLTCSNIKASQSGVITWVQDGTGSRTMVATWCSQFRWANGSRGVLSTAASAIDALFYQCISTTICYVSLGKAQAN